MSKTNKHPIRMSRCGKCPGCQADDVFNGQVLGQKVDSREFVKQELKNDPEKKNNIHQNQEKINVQKQGSTEQLKVEEQCILQTNLFIEDLETGEIDSSMQELVTEEPETGEIIDLDKETLILLIRNQATHTI